MKPWQNLQPIKKVLCQGREKRITWETERKHILANHISDKGLVWTIYKELSNLTLRKQYSSLEQATDLYRHLTKDGEQAREKCTASLAIREMQINVKYHHIPTKIAKTTPTIPSAGEDMEYL